MIRIRNEYRSDPKLLLFATLFLLPACGDEMNFEGEDFHDDIDGEETVDEQAIEIMGTHESNYVKNAYMSIAWPFVYESPYDWTGWQSTKTSGAYGRFCGVSRYTHDWAEYYARDLNRKEGGDSDLGKEVYAGMDAKVIKANDNKDGYGIDVVLYDKNRHVAVRYSHLSEARVRVGQTVRIRQLIGKVGKTGNASSAHLHLVGFENVNDNNGNPIIPNLCDSDFYSLILYFHS